MRASAAPSATPGPKRCWSRWAWAISSGTAPISFPAASSSVFPLPGMNANAEIVIAEAGNALAVPNAAIVRGGYVLVTKDSPSAANADPDMTAPEGYVYVPVKIGVSDDDYTQIISGVTGNDTVAYDPSSVSTDDYYDDGSSVMIF